MFMPITFYKLMFTAFSQVLYVSFICLPFLVTTLLQMNLEISIRGPPTGVCGAQWNSGTHTWLWLRIKQEGLRRFWSMFSLARVDFGTGFVSHSHSGLVVGFGGGEALVCT